MDEATFLHEHKNTEFTFICCSGMTFTYRNDRLQVEIKGSAYATGLYELEMTLAEMDEAFEDWHMEKVEYGRKPDDPVSSGKPGISPKKLIRGKIISKLKPGEWEEIEDPQELNDLYTLKLLEEAEEIKASEYKDIFEFVDLIQAAFSFAKVNGFNHEEISKALITKSLDKGTFSRTALNNLNPNNPSNAIYFSRSRSLSGPGGSNETIEAKIRNQLSPFWNLLAVVQDDTLKGETELFTENVRACVDCQQRILDLLIESETFCRAKSTTKAG